MNISGNGATLVLSQSQARRKITKLNRACNINLDYLQGMSMVRTWVVNTLAPVLLDQGRVSVCYWDAHWEEQTSSKYSMARLMIALSLSPELAEYWGSRPRHQQTVIHAGTGRQDPAQRKQISAIPSTNTRSFDSNKKMRRANQWNCSILLLLPIQSSPKWAQMLPNVLKTLCRCLCFVRGRGWAGLG